MTSIGHAGTGELPVDWKQVLITAQYVNIDGTPACGRIYFQSAQWVIVDGVIIVPKLIQVDLVNGAIPAGFSLPATNDPNLNLTGWAYMVTEGVAYGRPPYWIFVPYTDDTVNLATLAPVVPPPQLVTTIGPPGPPNILDVGTVSTGAPGTPVAVTITGASPSQVVNFTIPQGNPGSGSYLWGAIGGNISDQTDLITMFGLYAPRSSLATVATSGSYNDLANKPALFENPMTAQWQMILGGEAGAPVALSAPSSTGLVPTSQSDGSIVWQAPVAAIGGNVYMGVWDASTGSPPSAEPAKGQYWIVSVAGSTSLSGITDWNVNDWAIYNGTIWNQIVNDRVGLLLASQNLADVGNVVTARANLGLGSAALQNVGYFATAAQGALAATAVQPGVLATVATSGDYNDLINQPTLFQNPMSNAGDVIVGGFGGVPTALSLSGASAGWVLTFDGTLVHWAPVAANPYIVDTYTGDVPTIASPAGSYSLVIGTGSADASTDSTTCNVVIGPFASNNGTSSDFNVMVGYFNVNNGASNCSLFGNSITNSAVGNYAVLVGVSINNSGQYAIAIGEGVTTVSHDAIAIGRGSSVTVGGTSGIAIGQGAASAHANSVALGAGVITTKNNQLSIGTAGQLTAISFVAPGISPTDAVNVGQLASTDITGTPLYLGQMAVVGGIGYMATGTSSSADWKQITN